MLIRLVFTSVLFSFLTACGAGSKSDDAVIAAAKAGYDAFAAGDMEAWAATQAPDVKWEMPQGFPYGGNYAGPQQVIDEVFAPIAALWPDFKVEPTAFHASGNVVFIETKMTAGGQVSDSIHKAVINDGLYTEFQVYDDAGFMMAHAVGANSIGTQFFADGSSKPLQAGNSANGQIWLDYIAAHNARDFEKIASMNAEGFRGIATLKSVVEGSAAHTTFLQNWVADDNLALAGLVGDYNDGENKDGVMEEWLATGNLVTMTGADGERKAYETVDVLLEDGQIKLLNVAVQVNTTGDGSRGQTTTLVHSAYIVHPRRQIDGPYIKIMEANLWTLLQCELSLGLVLAALSQSATAEDLRIIGEDKSFITTLPSGESVTITCQMTPCAKNKGWLQPLVPEHWHRAGHGN